MTQLTRHRLPRARRRRRRAAGLCACCVELQRQLQPCRIRRHLLRRRRNTARAERVQRMPQAQPVPSRWTQKLGMHCAAPSTKGRRRATSTMSMRSAPLSVRFFAATCSGACSLTSAPSGTGGFAVVLQAMHRASRAAVAVKVLSLSTARIVETGVRQLARCRYKSLTSCAGLGSCADDAHGCAFAAVWCCARCGRRGRDAGGASLEEHRPVRQQAR